MTALTETYKSIGPLEREGAGPELTHARWGYMITSQDQSGLGARLGYLAFRCFGIALLLAAFGLWLAPGSSMNAEILPLKLGVSVLFLLTGGVAVWSSGDDRRDEMQVDLERKELRRGYRRGNGRFVTIADLPLSDAGDLFLTRMGQGPGAAVLYVRRKSSPQALEIAIGPEDLLIPLQQRVTQDIRRARQLKNRSHK